jgi:flagellar biosynthesis/type III secretory pathway protein FliH
VSTVTRGRVLRGPTGSGPGPATPRMDPGNAGRRIARAEIEARERAARIVADAETKARRIAEEAAARAAAEARDAEHAKLAAAYLVLRAAEEKRAERDLDRTVQLAAVLAERLLGSEIARDPALSAKLARQALSEARGARRARIEACPLDVDSLKKHLGSLDLPADACEVVANAELARGSLVLHTDLGTLDAKLAPQLDRLAAALKDALRTPA